MKIDGFELAELFNYDPSTGVITHKQKPRDLFKTDRGWKIANARLVGSVATVKRKGGYLYCMVGDIAVRAVTVALACMRIQDDDVTIAKYHDNDKTNLKFKNLDIRFKFTDERCEIVKPIYQQGRVRLDINTSAIFLNRKDSEDAKRKIDAVLKSYGFLPNGEKNNS